MDEPYRSIAARESGSKSMKKELLALALLEAKRADRGEQMKALDEESRENRRNGGQPNTEQQRIAVATHRVHRSIENSNVLARRAHHTFLVGHP